MQYPIEKGIVFETCPTSNTKTGIVKTLEEHPIKTFYQKGLTVTVNTDDPTMVNTDMNNE